jgi:pantoate--beta-alanine ligase
MKIARSREALGAAVTALRAKKGAIALVPTMGALHAGHVSLIKYARRLAPAVMASIFVNPSQFNDPADLARYPRDEAGDIAKLRDAGCDLVWLPDVTDVYPKGDATRVIVAGPALGFEATQRPGHFDGVATVVTKIFGAVRPDIAVFGEKDWQQLQVIRRLTEDLGLPPKIAAAPVLREADGLAMSSRNVFLNSAEREVAPLLFRALTQCAAAIAGGADVAASLARAGIGLRHAGFTPDYFTLIDGAAMCEIEVPVPGARLIAAALLGPVRLLDTVALPQQSE